MALEWLAEHNLVELDENSGTAVVTATQSGIAGHKSGLELKHTEGLYQELCSASKTMILDTTLHLLFICSQASQAALLNFEWTVSACMCVHEQTD